MSVDIWDVAYVCEQLALIGRKSDRCICVECLTESLLWCVL